MRAERADQDVAGEEGLEVDEGEGVRGCEEDLEILLGHGVVGEMSRGRRMGVPGL